MWEELLKIIVGGSYTEVELLGFIWFFIVGYIIYGLTEASGRDVNSRNTPKKWNWKFWFYDNWRRYITTILCTYVLFRFYTEISGHPFGYFDAVSLGLIGDGISATIKKRVRVMNPHRDRNNRRFDDYDEYDDFNDHHNDRRINGDDRRINGDDIGNRDINEERTI